MCVEQNLEEILKIRTNFGICWYIGFVCLFMQISIAIPHQHSEKYGETSPPNQQQKR